MEGPTPVSALIHAATMVTAGVYLIGRMHPIFDLAFWAHSTAALIGAVTALVAATIGIVQTDIKRVLAYSTMSQIGYMFLGVGLGAYAAGFYHLLAHAFFKALLFLGAGNVIHAMNDEQDMRRYGGLWKQLRPTSICFLIGSLALVGIFPLVGFFSKELILGDAFSKPDQGGFPQVMWAVGFLTAVLTGFYTGRMWWIAFWGEPARDRPVEHPHEAPPVMLVPVVILTVLTCIGGALQVNAGFDIPWRQVEDFLSPVVGPLPWSPRGLEWIPTAATLLLGGVAFLAAYNFYVSRVWRPWSAAVPWLQRLLERKYYFDEIYDAVFVRTMDGVANVGDRFLEEPVIDGAPTGVAAVAEAGAGTLSLTQSGYFRTYVLVFVGGALLGLAVILLARTAG
jgi:NADH-quinone oxidoreductase subunit L